MPDTREISHLDLLKTNIAHNLFVDTADQNYVVARWCYQQGLYLDFLWNGVHALEKLMKAALLLNGRSSIRSARTRESYQHDLARLHAELAPIAGDLIPSALTRPDQVDMHWRDESFAEFIGRFSAAGDPNNRYLILGYVIHMEDLYKFDRAVFTIRRLCCPLDKYFWGRPGRDLPSLTYREALARDAGYMPHDIGSRFSSLAGDASPPEVRTAALNHNAPFSQPGFDHQQISVSSSSVNPVLYRRIIELAEHGTNEEGAKEAIVIADWVVQSIYLPTEVKGQINDACLRLKAMISCKDFTPFVGPPNT
jgi:hypothetical protein